VKDGEAVGAAAARVIKDEDTREHGGDEGADAEEAGLLDVILRPPRGTAISQKSCGKPPPRGGWLACDMHGNGRPKHAICQACTALGGLPVGRTYTEVAVNPSLWMCPLCNDTCTCGTCAAERARLAEAEAARRAEEERMAAQQRSRQGAKRRAAPGGVARRPGQPEPRGARAPGPRSRTRACSGSDDDFEGLSSDEDDSEADSEEDDSSACSDEDAAEEEERSEDSDEEDCSSHGGRPGRAAKARVRARSKGVARPGRTHKKRAGSHPRHRSKSRGGRPGSRRSNRCTPPPRKRQRRAVSSDEEGSEGSSEDEDDSSSDESEGVKRGARHGAAGSSPAHHAAPPLADADAAALADLWAQVDGHYLAPADAASGRGLLSAVLHPMTALGRLRAPGEAVSAPLAESAPELAADALLVGAHAAGACTLYAALRQQPTPGADGDGEDLCAGTKRSRGASSRAAADSEAGEPIAHSWPPTHGLRVRIVGGQSAAEAVDGEEEDVVSGSSPPVVGAAEALQLSHSLANSADMELWAIDDSEHGQPPGGDGGALGTSGSTGRAARAWWPLAAYEARGDAGDVTSVHDRDRGLHELPLAERALKQWMAEIGSRSVEEEMQLLAKQLKPIAAANRLAVARAHECLAAELAPLAPGVETVRTRAGVARACGLDKELSHLLLERRRAHGRVRRSATEVLEHDSLCAACNDGGLLLCCDGCTSAFHHKCAGLDKPPAEHEPWLCDLCQGERAREELLRAKLEARDAALQAAEGGAAVRV